jgi:hypothetical protein
MSRKGIRRELSQKRSRTFTRTVPEAKRNRRRTAAERRRNWFREREGRTIAELYVSLEDKQNSSGTFAFPLFIEFERRYGHNLYEEIGTRTAKGRAIE